MNNPIELIKMFMKQGNPKQLVEKLVINNTNPMIKDLIQKAQNGDTKAVEQFARNLFKEQGKNFDEEFNNFCNQFGFKK